MKRVAAIALMVAATVVGAASARPLKVMSLSECTDQLVLQLLPPQQITSVTWLSRDPSISIMARAAARTPINYGGVEEVVRDKPDLVIADGFTAPAPRALLQRLHYPLLVLGSAESFDDIRGITRQAAAAVGAKARGEALLAHMDAALDSLAKDRAPPLRIAAWDGAGFSARKGSLYDAILTAAGARNVVDEKGVATSGAPSVEMLLKAAPALLVRGEPGFDRPGRQSDVAFHPVIRRFWRGRTLVVPQSAYICGTPLSADAALSLRDQMRALLAKASRPPPFGVAIQ